MGDSTRVTGTIRQYQALRKRGKPGHASGRRLGTAGHLEELDKTTDGHPGKDELNIRGHTDMNKYTRFDHIQYDQKGILVGQNHRSEEHSERQGNKNIAGPNSQDNGKHWWQ